MSFHPQRLQHQIDPKNELLFNKFEKNIPLCTSYIVASLQYQTKIANYHLQAMEMCLSLFNTASDDVMRTIANLKMEIISLFWMPIEFVGDYNTQKLSLKLIVKVFSYMSEEQKKTRISEINSTQEIRSLVLKLTAVGADFEKISRELLNNFNMKTTKNCAVFSVYCRSALFGCYELFKPRDIDRFWIDFNYTTKSVSVLCEVRLRDNVQERISIQIKIEKMQIKNKFDCIVLSIEPAIFSKTVSTELSNARVAVFTLPQSEVQRLLRNKDLIDFYNSTKNQSNSDIIEPRSQGTIENFLAEEEQANESNREVFEESRGVIQGLTEIVTQDDIPRRQARVQTQPQNEFNAKQSTATNRLPSKTRLTKESGYGPSISAPTVDSPIFKVPTQPIRQRAPRRKSNQATKRKPSSRTRAAPKSKPTDPQLNQSSSLPRTESKRFFKSTTSKPTDLPRTQTIARPPKKASSNRYSGVSPKRKQVNTVRPLNHLTQPDCDPQEAALEYVENGGYANIISFIRSSAGVASFNDQQRKQILENVERINEDLDRSSRRFFPKALSSGTDSGDDETVRKSPLKQKTTGKFVPFSTWKVKQKQKSYTPATVATPIPKEPPRNPPLTKCKVTLSAFDQLKGCKENAVSQLAAPSQPENILNSKPPSRSGSQSSGSIHNFHIVESDRDSDRSDMDISPTDMECRRAPSNKDVSVIPAPNHVKTPPWQGKSPAQSFQMSASYSEIIETPQGIAFELAKDWASDCQVSEVFEDLDGELSNNEACNLEYACEENQPTAPSQCSPENNTYKESTVYSTKSSHYDENTAVISPQENNNWYIEKYLKDQERFYQSPTMVQTSIRSPQRPNITTTNQVIIQNKIVVSADRKRSRSPHAESPLPKLPLVLEHFPLRGYSQLLPEYMKQMSAEKKRLLNKLEHELQDRYFEKIKQIAEEFQKTTGEYEAEINEVQEQLTCCLGQLEWLIEEKQKKRSQFEGACTELKRRMKSCQPKREDIIQAYEAAESELETIATSTASQLWQGFANNIVTSIETRLRDLVKF